jgi:hypothetical protein
MIYNLQSVKYVIAKVFTDLDLKEGDHRISDMISYAGEALEKIGGFPTFNTRVCGKDELPLLTVANYQTKLPCDFHSMIQVAYATVSTGPFYPMRYATGSFDSGVPNTATTAISYTASESDLATLALALYPTELVADALHTAYEHAIIKLNAEPATRALLNSLLTPTSGLAVPDTNGTTTDYTYMIKGGYIKTNVETGYIMLAYQAIPTDTQGYPMIPDNASFMEAIYWYITMKLLYPQWAAGQVRDAVYADAKRSWNYYCKQAYGNAMMPNGAEQMESIKNTWHRLVEEWGEHDSFFSTLGQEQVIFNPTK